MDAGAGARLDMGAKAGFVCRGPTPAMLRGSIGNISILRPSLARSASSICCCDIGG